MAVEEINNLSQSKMRLEMAGESRVEAGRGGRAERLIKPERIDHDLAVFKVPY